MIFSGNGLCAASLMLIVILFHCKIMEFTKFLKLNIIVLILSLTTSFSNFANQPDSVYLVGYTPVGGTNGLRLAWSHNPESKNWFHVGDGIDYLRCDFGPWGIGKKMFSPILFYDNSTGLWHCYWKATSSGNTLAHASSDNLIEWIPQEYFASTDVPENSPLNSGGTDLAHIYIDSAEYLCAYTKVPFTFIRRLNDFADHQKYRESLHNQLMVDDIARFQGLDSVNATVRLNPQNSKDISSNLIGVFFEDINYSADGGLYGELIQNRDFEYYIGENDRDKSWGPLKGWHTENNGKVEIRVEYPIHENNCHYATLHCGSMVNEGFDGISLKKDDLYYFYAKARLSGNDKSSKLKIILRDDKGNPVAEKTLSVKGKGWQDIKATLVPNKDVRNGSIEILNLGNPTDLDLISLFPKNTFKNRKNGLRADIAQTIADISPRFVRFPGGCVAHGNGIENMYDWKGSIGPLEARKPLRNSWNYHQSRGLGYYEYFLFCEDIGAEPLPVIAAGVPCQNSDGRHSNSEEEILRYGQQNGIKMEKMTQYVQDALDLIEYANGDAKNSVWGKKRAEAGHPEPFNLKYLGVGNEDLISPVFEERFLMIYNAIKEKYPEIKVIGTVGPYFEGSDYDEGWRFASENGVPLVDEHYYVRPGWMIHNQNYYDTYDRTKPHVYLGEYAAHMPNRANNLETALAEALYLTSIERNADVVEMTSYAPLLAKRKHTQWAPDLIFFDNDTVLPTVSYFTQKMYGNNSGSRYIPADIEINSDNSDVIKRVGFSAVIDEKSGDTILKLVNMLPIQVDINIAKSNVITNNEAMATILSGNPNDSDAKPVSSKISFDIDNPCYAMPPYSFTVLRFANR